MDFTAADLPARVEGADGQRFSVERLKEDYRPGGVLQLQFYGLHGHGMWELHVTPAFLLQVRDLIGRVLNDAKQPPVRVSVQLFQPGPPEPPTTVQVVPIERLRDDVDDVEAIKRRMLEGR